MKTVVIIQARMGSTRLPGKVMKELCGQTVLKHVVERVKQCSEMNEIIIATTTHSGDDRIEKEAQNIGVKCFRGSESDVLSRYYYAAKESNADIVVRITSDCPLIDPKVMDNVIRFYKEHDYPYVSNSNSNPSNLTFPRGLDTEVFGFEDLEEAFVNAKEPYQREHVTPYLYEEGRELYIYKNDNNYSEYRWTLDTEEDYAFIQKVYENLYKGKHNFYLNDIITLMEKKPELYEINKDIKQKKLK